MTDKTMGRDEAAKWLSVLDNHIAQLCVESPEDEAHRESMVQARDYFAALRDGEGRAIPNDLAEAFAKAIYEQWSDMPGYVPWVERGNSDMQCKARRILHNAMSSTAPPAKQPEAQAVASIVRDVAELPDRSSPEDWPEAMLVTADELAEIVRRHIPTTPAVGVDGMLPDTLSEVSAEWYELCERAAYVDRIKISGQLAEAIVATICAGKQDPPAKQPEAQAVIPKAKDWLEQINGAASREWMDGWDACRVEYELFLAAKQPEAQAVAWMDTDEDGDPRGGRTADDVVRDFIESMPDDDEANPTAPAVGVERGPRITQEDIAALVAGPFNYHHKMNERQECEAKGFDRCRELTLERIAVFFAARELMHTAPPVEPSSEGVTDEMVDAARNAAMSIKHNKEVWFPMTDRRLRRAIAAALATKPAKGGYTHVPGVGDYPTDYVAQHLPEFVADGHEFVGSPKLGGEICSQCGAVKGTRRGRESCRYAPGKPAKGGEE